MGSSVIAAATASAAACRGACRRPAPGVKEQALDMHAEGSSLSAIGRVLGYSAQAVSQWVKRGAAGPGRLRERSRRRAEGTVGRQPAMVVSCDEMWTYRRGGHGERREDCWIRTVVARGADGGRWVDFEVGDRSEGPSCDCTKGCPMRDCTAAMLIRCTWDGFPQSGMWRAKAGR